MSTGSSDKSHLQNLQYMQSSSLTSAGPSCSASVSDLVLCQTFWAEVTSSKLSYQPLLARVFFQSLGTVCFTPRDAWARDTREANLFTSVSLQGEPSQSWQPLRFAVIYIPMYSTHLMWCIEHMNSTVFTEQNWLMHYTYIYQFPWWSMHGLLNIGKKKDIFLFIKYRNIFLHLNLARGLWLKKMILNFSCKFSTQQNCLWRLIRIIRKTLLVTLSEKRRNK